MSNVFREMIRNLNLKMTRRLSAVVFLCAAVGLSTALALRGVDTKLSAQSLLLEAARDGGPLDQIFAQQAGQGYYEDALSTAHLASSITRNQEYELSGYVEDLIQIRAENGDIQGAKEMVGKFSETALVGLGPKVTLEIAKIQVDKGDLHGALETCPLPADANEVMEEFGNLQIRRGDLDGALETAERLNERSAYDLFYNVGSALRERGEPQRLHVLASHMTDKKRAAEFLDSAQYALRPNVEIKAAAPCDMAVFDAHAGKFMEAWSVVQQNKCDSSYIAIKQYASDPAEAERELLRTADEWHQTYGLSEMSKAAARKGDILNALRLLNLGRRISGDPDFCPYCVRDIAWAWTLKRQSGAALDWAHSLPTLSERGFALLGIAQALAHPRAD